MNATDNSPPLRSLTLVSPCGQVVRIDTYPTRLGRYRADVTDTADGRETHATSCTSADPTAAELSAVGFANRLFAIRR